jgi:YidC/Oxa1 family membrane protein insertase
MNTDKNTVIGIVLLGILFFAFFWYTNREQQILANNTKLKNDSIAKANQVTVTAEQIQARQLDSLRADSLEKVGGAGDFSAAAFGEEQLTVVENSLIKASFTSKGGRIKSVELKKYKNNAGRPVILGGSISDKIAYNINTGNNKSALSSDLFFNASAVQKAPDGTQTLSFSLTDNAGKSLVHQYSIRPNDYKIDWNITLTGASQLLTNQTINFQFFTEMTEQEADVEYERRVSNICFSEGNEFDYISSKTDRTFEQPVQWVGAVQQFFNTTLIAKNNFSGGSLKWTRFADDSSKIVGTLDANLQMKVPAAATVTVPMELFFGPNEYETLVAAYPEMDKMINLGRDLYSFVRPINKYIIMPVFNFFAGIIRTYGWVIALLTIFIRVVTSPLTYRSYVSGSKMKVLRPEIDALRKKFGEDQQQFSMEQMKLFREAGVNPLGGCLPMLLQIPIFFALYSFFNSNIALRGQSFLWAPDLSTFDVLTRWGTKIWVIGDHLSLFALLAVATSFLISLYNMNMTATDPNNPMLKYMPFIFPIFMFIIFNSLPSALNWYYTVSNVITLLIQFIIQRFILNHDKILADIEAKRKAAPSKPKSRWQEMMEKTAEQQKKIEQMKQQSRKK